MFGYDIVPKIYHDHMSGNSIPPCYRGVCNVREPVTMEAYLASRQAYRNLTGSQIAKIRLRIIVAKDRKECGDGKWVMVRAATVGGIPWRNLTSRNHLEASLIKMWERIDKATYRWAVRR